MEFISESESREMMASEILRVTKPTGHIFIATPSPFRFRELHTRRFLGDFRRTKGYPWSSSPTEVRRMFGGCEPVAIGAFVVCDILRRRRVPGARYLSFAHPVILSCLPWQKHLLRRGR